MRSRRNGAERVYSAAEKWVNVALRTDGSLFTPGQPIWTPSLLEELHRKVLDRPDEGEGDFYDKLEKQLVGSPPDVYQLMGEVLYAHFLIVSTSNSANQRGRISTVLNWSPSPVQIPQGLVAALTPGIANPGTGFHTYRPFQVGLLIEFVEQWKKLAPEERERRLNDPWAFKDFVMDLRPHSHLLRNSQNTPRIQRQALLHLTHPDTFEAMVNLDHKRQISKTFEAYVSDPRGGC